MKNKSYLFIKRFFNQPIGNNIENLPKEAKLVLLKLFKKEFEENLFNELLEINNKDSQYAYIKRLLRVLYTYTEKDTKKHFSKNTSELFHLTQTMVCSKIFELCSDLNINTKTIFDEIDISLTKNEINEIHGMKIESRMINTDSLDEILKPQKESELEGDPKVNIELQQRICWLYSLGVIDYLKKTYQTHSNSTIGNILSTGIDIKSNTIKVTLDRIDNDNLLNKYNKFLNAERTRLKIDKIK